MNNKILFVDDDENILQGIRRTLRGKFEIETVNSGTEGLEKLNNGEEFAVVVSDMRMPQMDGIEFLSGVKTFSPDSIRIMLTGNSDQETAIQAVNEGSIFRFLNKPCATETLSATLTAAIEQYRLKKTERELLEVTLNQSLNVLIDILALVNPTAFSRSSRVKNMARYIAVKLGVDDLWEIEIAATLSQIGCITVPEEVLAKLTSGEPFTDEELGLYQRHPEVAFQLVSQIPRMENVAAIIRDQNRRVDSGGDEPVEIGSRILKVVLDYDKLINLNTLPDVAYAEMKARSSWYEPIVLQMLKELIDQDTERFVDGELHVSELRPGMVLNESIRTKKGMLLLSEDQEITFSIMLRLVNFAEAKFINEMAKVRVPASFADSKGLFKQKEEPQTESVDEDMLVNA